MVSLVGVSLSKLQSATFHGLFSSEKTMQAQRYASTKMDYLVYNGYNNLAEQSKKLISDSTFKDAVALGGISTDDNGVSRRTVTVSVYSEDETQPRARIQQVFYSNDANKYVTNGSSATSSISMNYDKDNDRLYAMVDGQEKLFGSAGGVPVGTIIAWPFNTAPNEYGTWLLCDGSVYSAATYPKLYALSKSATLPNLRDRFLQGSTIAGKFVEPGLPNITGTIRENEPGIDQQFFTENVKANSFEGAFCNLYGTYSVRAFTGPDGWGCEAPMDVSFDASRSNAIYGASTTVQPSSYTVRYYIKAA